MKIQAIPVGAFDVNCWILSTPARHAVVFDPGTDAPLIANYLQKEHLEVKGYLITHGHMDHISALAPLCKDYPAPIRIHPRDAAWAFSPANQMLPYYPAPQAPPAERLHADLVESTGNRIVELSYDVIETPGHSPGCVCIHFPELGILFTGDTIFADSAGRTDFPGGNAEDQKRSLQRLRNLPPKTILYPGHGPSTTLETERHSNPFLQ